MISTVPSLLIYKKAAELVKKHGSRNPLRIADEMNIKLSYCDNLQDLLGMYTCMWRHRIIVLNARLDGPMLNIVTAHELGHDIFHRRLAMQGGLKEFVLFDIKDETEYVANAFAAHLLLDDDDILTLAKSGEDIVHIAAQLNTDVNLALIKLQELSRLGYGLRLPDLPDATFLSKMRVKNNGV